MTNWVDLKDVLLSEIARHKKINTACSYLWVDSKHQVQNAERRMMLTEAVVKGRHGTLN